MPSHFILQTDARGIAPGDKHGSAAIGAVLRQRQNNRWVVVDYISKKLGRESVGEAEYKALIAGLKLARHHRASKLRVYLDAEFVVDQVNKKSPRLKPEFKRLHAEARALIEEFGNNIKVSWIPREMNTEADQRVNDALLR